MCLIYFHRNQTTIRPTAPRLGRIFNFLFMALSASCATKVTPPNKPVGGNVYLYRSSYKIMGEPIRIFINDRFEGELLGLRCKVFHLPIGENSIYLQAANFEKISLPIRAEDEIFLIDIGRLNPPNSLTRIEIESSITISPKTLPKSCTNE